jgi:hypothetical protein
MAIHYRNPLGATVTALTADSITLSESLAVPDISLQAGGNGYIGSSANPFTVVWATGFSTGSPTQISYNATGVNAEGPLELVSETSNVTMGSDPAVDAETLITGGLQGIRLRTTVPVYPSTDNVIDLGQAAKRFKSAYLSGDVNVDSDSYHYFGASNVDGSWRIGRSGDDLVHQRRESGEWVTKDTIAAAG